MSFFNAKQTKFTAYATLYTAIVLAALGLVNFLANRYNKSLDLTANKRYSLADQTEKIVRNLKTDVTVRYFDQQSRFQNAKDLLDRYDNLSTRFNVVYSDPERNPQQARALGVREMGTVVVEANGRREQAKAVTEQEITSALIRVLKDGERKVCPIAGSGEASFQEQGRSGYSNLSQLLTSNNYKVEAIRVLEKPEIPPSCTIVLIGGPKFDYAPQVITALKVWTEGGGRLMVLLDPPLKVGTTQVADNQPLLDLLSGWGVTPKRSLIFDESILGPAVIAVQEYEGHDIVKEMRGVPTLFPLSRPLEISEKPNVKAKKLFSSSPTSYDTKEMAKPEPVFDAAKNEKGPFTIGVAAEYTAGGGKQPGRFVVVGSSSWAGNGSLGQFGNQDLAMNMVNWLSSDEDLISIRPRQQDNRLLDRMGPNGLRTLTLTSLVLVPSLILMMGIAVWWKRR